MLIFRPVGLQIRQDKDFFYYFKGGSKFFTILSSLFP